MRISIIGAGFGGLSAAAYLAQAGHEVTVYEKNSGPGGRATTVYQAGFQFELGPSWYLMPDVFEEFFADFGRKSSDFYALRQLVPSYRVYDQAREFMARPRPAAGMDFEQLEAGSGARLASLLDRAEQEYGLVRQRVLPLSGLRRRDYLQPGLARLLARRELLGSYHRRIAGTVTHPTLQHVLEFMTVFLGGSPRSIPAVYGLLAHVDFGLGVWYPAGGFTAVARALETVAQSQGATIRYDAPVERLSMQDGRLGGVIVDGQRRPADVVVANADYHFVDSKLTPAPHRIFSPENWRQKTVSPSAVMATLGLSRRVNLEHHTLFFDTDWEAGFADVFERHRVGDVPLFYVSTPSKSDPRVAPENCENLFILIPVSSKASVSQARAEALVRGAVQRIEQRTGDAVTPHIVVKNVYPPEYFSRTFNAYRGNAFGLSHTLGQSGPLRPPLRSPKLPNLYFTGQYTNPGTGVPLVLLSGKTVAREIGSGMRP